MKKSTMFFILLTLFACNNVESSSIDFNSSSVHNHIASTPVQENRVEPTCVDDGFYDLVTYCIDDNVEISREKVTIPSLGHDEITHDGKPATCLENGYYDYVTCSRCDYSTYRVITATGHNNLATREENKIDSTCDKEGSYDLVTYCIDDNVEISREKVKTSSLGHKFGSWIVDNNPSDLVDGNMHRECSRCQKVETKTFDIKVSYEMLNFVKSGNSYIAKPVSQDIEGYLFVPSTYNNLPVIAVSEFEYCSWLSYVVLQDGIKMIDNYAFRGCSSITDLILPNTIISVGEYAFQNCTSLKNITVSKNLTSMGYSVFTGCSSLENVYYLGTIEDWCYITFSNDYSNPMYSAKHFYRLNTSNDWYEVINIELPKGIKSVNKYQFYGFNNVKKINIPDNITSLGFCAFTNCSSLIDITIPSSVVTIGEEVFRDCSSLTDIYISSSVNTLSKWAFENCSSLKNVYYSGTIEDWCYITFGNENSNPMYYGTNFYLSTSTNEWKKLTELELPSNLPSVGNYQFCGFNNIIKVNLSNITLIGDGAFSYCDSLSEVIIPSGVSKIGNRSFYNCYKLSNVDLPNTLTSIGAFSFYNCEILKSIFIPGSVYSIGSYTFYGCKSLTINCEANAQPSSWDSNWNKSNCPVNFGSIK